MYGARDLSRYWRGGSVELQIPWFTRRSWGVRFIRNGRILGLELHMGRFFCAPAIYRHWGDE